MWAQTSLVGRYVWTTPSQETTLVEAVAASVVDVVALATAVASAAVAETVVSVAVAGIAYVLVHLIAVPERVHDLALVVIAGAVVVIPLAFLVTVVRRYAARAAVADHHV